MRLWLVFAILTTFVTGVESCPFPTACENGGVCGPTSVCNCKGTGFAGTSCQEKLSFTITRTPNTEDVDEGSSIEIEISRTNPNYAVTLVGSVSGTAENEDVSLEAFSFQNGDTLVKKVMTIVDDDFFEPKETVVLSFSPQDDTYKIPQELTFNILDNDPLTVTNTRRGPFSEGDGAVSLSFFTISMSEETVDITLTVTSDDASEGVDYDIDSSVINFNTDNAATMLATKITFRDDSIPEPDKTLTFTFTSSTALSGDTKTNIVLLDDDDEVITVTGPASNKVNENDSVATFTLTREISFSDVVITYTVTSNRPDGSVYSKKITEVADVEISFKAGGSMTQSFDVKLIDDELKEPDQTFDVEFTVKSGKVEPIPSVTVNVAENDVEVLTLTVSSRVSEDIGALSVTLTRTSNFENLVVAATTLMGTADSSDVQSLSSQTLTFGNAKTVNFELNVTDDMVAEPDETFDILVDAPDPIMDVSTAITILDNDPDTISIDTFPGVAENGGSKIVTLSRTVSQKELTVTVEATDVTAKEGTDFTIDSDATFAVGALQATFTVMVEDDDLEEGLETFSITISGSSSEVKSDVLATFQIADNEGSRPFDCRRKNQGCETGTDVCYPDFPFCVCTGGDPREGEMCNIVTSQKNGTGCPSTCTENGQCLSVGGVVSCACKPGYFGDNCENYFLKAECSSSAMKLIVNPHGEFDGVIYVAEKLGESTCRAEDGENGFAVEVDHDSTACGEISPVEGETETSYSRKFIIQYDESILTQLDQCVTVSCKFDKDNVLVDTGVITVDPSGPLTEESTSDLFSPVSLQIRDISGSPVTESMVVPISKKLCVTLSIPSAFGGLEMIDIEFNNTLKASPKKLLVLSAGCETNKAKFVFANPPFYLEPGNKKVIRFCFFAFKFVDIEKLAITMKVKICVKPEDCFETTCNPVREKREASEETRTETLGTIFTISNPAQQTSASQNGTEGGTSNVRAETTCDYPSHYLPTLIGLGVLVLMLVLLVLFLTYRLARRPSKTHHPQKPEPWFMKYPSHFSSK